MKLPPQVIIFCKVIDNYGDIGVCLRLARGLIDRACRVTLVTDRPDLATRMDPAAEVKVVSWDAVAASPGCLDVTKDMLVVEAFQATPPLSFLQACPTKLSRVCLDYLATEAWADGLQWMPAPDPAFPSHSRIWMAPSFSSNGPGLIRGRWEEIDAETRLAMRRRLISNRSDGTASALHEVSDNRDARIRMGVSMANAFDLDHVFLILAFGYDDAPWGALAEAIARQGLPEGFDRVCFVKPAGLAYAHSEFDAVLQSCDLNFVRGEDSFVRAHFAAAGRWHVPFVWQPYRQEWDAHQQKLYAWQQSIRKMNGEFDHPVSVVDAGKAQPYWNAWLGVESFFNPLSERSTGGQDAASVGERQWAPDRQNPVACAMEDDFAVCWSLLIAHWTSFLPAFSSACQALIGDRALEDSVLSAHQKGIRPTV
jgi:hypothetical protein